jgi:hypothetical protein
MFLPQKINPSEKNNLNMKWGEIIQRRNFSQGFLTSIASERNKSAMEG